MRDLERIAGRVEDGQAALAAIVAEYVHLLEHVARTPAERARLERATQRAIARIREATR